MTMSKKERENRIIAFGEFSDHCHAICGPAIVAREGDNVFITVKEDAEADVEIKHLLESAWRQGKEVEIYAKEEGRDGHESITMEPGTYEYVPQVEKDPYRDVIHRVLD